MGERDIRQRLGWSEVEWARHQAELQGCPAPRWQVDGRPAWEWAEVADWARLVQPVAPAPSG